MTFDIYYKINESKLDYVGLANVDGAKKVSFKTFESAIIFEDKLLRCMHNGEHVTNKKIKELSKGGE